MASILDRYGIKEVADVTFYELNADGTPGKPVLFLDTLKVSTIEQTAEQVDARGGKGNPKLITWDYGKEITVTIEDALFSPKSMAIMLGDGQGTVNQGGRKIRKTCVVRLKDTLTADTSLAVAANDYITADIFDENSTNGGATRAKLYLGPETNPPAGEVKLNGQLLFVNGEEKSALYDENGAVIDSDFTETELKNLYQTGISSAYAGHKVMFTYWVNSIAKEIIVSGDKFPGTYYIQGDTYSRSDVTGADQFFQFIIPKAKMSAENTITLEAEGDPATFSMNLTVLRPESGEMMKLVQYDLQDPSAG